MNILKLCLFNIVFTAIFFSTNILAHDDKPSGTGVTISNEGVNPVYADSHAPIGVMAEHIHKKGEWMLSYRFQHMYMEDNLIDDSAVAPERIITTVPNRFFGLSGQPFTLRVVPTEMSMDMHMFGGMFAPTDWLTLMVMGMYVEKDMDHITFAGGMGTTRSGTFNTKSDGFGDTRVTGMFKVYHNGNHRIQLNLGMSLPTGSITEKDQILTPMGGTPTVRLPYAMQLGSGTFDVLPGIVYTGNNGSWGWGAQYSGTFRIGDNHEDYQLGNKQMITSWASYRWFDGLSTSFRIQAAHLGQIDGIDSSIVAPVQTADPDNYGGETMTVLFGFNLAGQSGILRGHRLALEAGFPIYQDLNGPQLETDMVITAGWQYAF